MAGPVYIDGAWQDTAMVADRIRQLRADLAVARHTVAYQIIERLRHLERNHPTQYGRGLFQVCIAEVEQVVNLPAGWVPTSQEDQPSP